MKWFSWKQSSKITIAQALKTSNYEICILLNILHALWVVAVLLFVYLFEMLKPFQALYVWRILFGSKLEIKCCCSHHNICSNSLWVKIMLFIVISLYTFSYKQTIFAWATKNKMGCYLSSIARLPIHLELKSSTS